MTAPRRRYTVDIQIGADDLDEVLSVLRHLEGAVRSGSQHIVSGGPTSGFTLQVVHDPAMTHDEYFRQVAEYLRLTKTPGGD